MSARALVERMLRLVAKRYVDADVAAAMQAALGARLARGAYDSLPDGPQLSQTLTTHLQEISRDAHLAVLYHPDAQPTDPKRAEQQEREDMQRLGPLINFYLDRAERLNGNVGLVALRGFFAAHIAGASEAIAAAMTVIAHTEALILDLRRNGGGEPAMVALLCGYFFPEPLLSVNFITRSGQTESQNWTPAHLAGPRYLDRPIYVLTSAMTASGAEECVYTLKTRGRATLVGEPTLGATNLPRTYQLDEHHLLQLPECRPISPVTGSNWEGGIAPDIPATRDDALPWDEHHGVRRRHVIDVRTRPDSDFDADAPR
jgi:C-terminal processing protease CtpA/Prc